MAVHTGSALLSLTHSGFPFSRGFVDFLVKWSFKIRKKNNKKLIREKKNQAQFIFKETA